MCHANSTQELNHRTSGTVLVHWSNFCVRGTGRVRKAVISSGNRLTETLEKPLLGHLKTTVAWDMCSPSEPRFYLHIIPSAKNFTGGPFVIVTSLPHLKDILFRFDTMHPDAHVNFKHVIILNAERTTEVKDGRIQQRFRAKKSQLPHSLQNS